MTRYKHILSSLLLAGIVSAFFACTGVDDRLGMGLESERQQTAIGRKKWVLFPNSTLLETRLVQQDDVRSSNRGRGYFGATEDAVWGTRRAGFLTQYHTASLSDLDEGGFGDDAVFDSIQLKLFIKEHIGDTLQAMRYNIYEANDSWLDGHPDTLFYPTFDPTPYVASEPAFTFTFPDGTSTGPYTEYITLTPTPAGRELVDRLMAANENSRGCFYVAPVAGDSGNAFATDLEGTGLQLYAHNPDTEDPSKARDTVTASYAFLTPARTNASVNVVERDYTTGSIDLNSSSTLYIDGMSGVVPQLTFTEALMQELKALLEQDFSSIVFNRAQLILYVDSPDWNALNPATITPLLDLAMGRLGCYTEYYGSLTPVPDYDYLYEKISGISLPYDATLNRSRACYTLDLSVYLQSLWNDLRDGKPIEATITLGPEALNPYDLHRTTIQNVELDVVYTLID